MRLYSRNLTAIALSLIVAVTMVQSAGIIPMPVYAANTLTLQLTRAATSTDSISSSGELEVNLGSGQLTMQLNQASPNSVYTAIMVTGETNLQLGNITTGNQGDGHLEATLTAGTYAGIFQIFRLGVLQFASTTTSFVIDVTATTILSTSNSSFTTSTLTNKTVSGTAQIQFLVEPPSRAINARDYARFDIQIHANGTANILLAVKGIPPSSTAIFTQEAGLADPDFHSTLIIVTSEDTPIGTYGITVISIINGQEFDAQINLTIVQPSSTTTTHTSPSTNGALEMSISTDRHQYEANTTVSLLGHVSDQTGNAVSDASVSVQVDGPNGAQVDFVSSLTDPAGVFAINFLIPPSATTGTYTVFASTARSGYTRATTHTTFVVGLSSTPSVVIKEVYTTDMSGNRSAVFSTGQTVLVWVVIENGGSTFNGVIWVQIRDSNGTPMWIQFQITPLATGQTVQVAFGFQVTSGMSSGLYSANALVSDKLISQGGTFFASSNTEFAITS